MFNYKVAILILVFSISSINSEKIKVLIASPIRQKPKILKEFLASLISLNKSKYQADYYFIDDNTNVTSKSLIAEFSKKVKVNGSNTNILSNKNNYDSDSYVCDENTHYWNNNLVWKVAYFKDKIINFAKENNYNYLFLIDSDLVLHPETLNSLIDSKKDIISNIFWTKWTPNSIEMPNAWLCDKYTMYLENNSENLSQEKATKRSLEFINMLKKPGVYKVGGLGACTVISNKALNSGVCFKKIDNLSMWGEDRHFCVRARVLGLELWVSTYYPSYHIYRESNLLGLEEFIKNNYIFSFSSLNNSMARGTK